MTFLRASVLTWAHTNPRNTRTPIFMIRVETRLADLDIDKIITDVLVTSMSSTTKTISRYT